MSYYNDPNQGYQQGYAAPPAYPQQQQQQAFGQQASGYNQPQGYPDQHHGKQQPQQQAPPEVSDSGNFQGMSYTIKHRNTNSTLNIQLNQGDVVMSKPGAMIHMSSTVTLQGAIKFSMKKLFTGGQMAQATFTGPGTVALAPTLMGDIVTLPIDGGQGRPWNVGKDAFLACTSGVEKDTKSQGLGKALFSGEDLFVYRMQGSGIAWLTSYGAVETIQLQPGEQHIVDNGHLVAWNCQYAIERAGSGGLTMIKSGEGLVCRFTGPGTVYMQTRNLHDFAQWVREQVPSS
ncbi:hypothetical protein LTR36_002763 [Oleoguttula mirabilis]|uniref:Altered inheritance of mitochondria protein 24, mitochondrial n=1 Tax=Oleoguttula mirabilis TaxID=1507867 RepID=A0AAV9JJF7_9PEZI|nr:hypothetical protein LTR36_002763 [Oleoguttula mirabilis]